MRVKVELEIEVEELGTHEELREFLEFYYESGGGMKLTNPYDGECPEVIDFNMEVL